MQWKFAMEIGPEVHLYPYGGIGKQKNSLEPTVVLTSNQAANSNLSVEIYLGKLTDLDHEGTWRHLFHQGSRVSRSHFQRVHFVSQEGPLVYDQYDQKSVPKR